MAHTFVNHTLLKNYALHYNHMIIYKSNIVIPLFWRYFGPSKIANRQLRKRQNLARSRQNRGMGQRAQ